MLNLFVDGEGGQYLAPREGIFVNGKQSIVLSFSIRFCFDTKIISREFWLFVCEMFVKC